MPITLEFIEDGHILHYRFVVPWANAELKEHLDRELEYRNSVPFLTHTIVDFSKSPVLPPGGFQYRQFPALVHPSSGAVAMVITSDIVRSVVESGLRLIRNKRISFFATADDAHAYLRDFIGHTDAQRVG